jgi:hypothetical protein
MCFLRTEGFSSRLEPKGLDFFPSCKFFKFLFIRIGLKCWIRFHNPTHADPHHCTSTFKDPEAIKFGSRTAGLFCGLTWPAESRLAVENFFTILLSEGFCSGFFDLLPGLQGHEIPIFLFFTIYKIFHTKIMQLSHQMLSTL